ncbi:Signal transduction histidine-protein kinase BarA [Acaryochloris thomasi RCC1774]|uniref:histidine kinase n=1 Tax=Acaryochloris thomasi RCC1774 TaxID=1764569 RepID=A0A2W1K0V0_9CYAN|nr:hybrid sensor histidine kinase/response regulator [Acaryochloris thomasi]PZD75134.1 Signal transduction histidine-protein kinase BarA [Acaryochloris thomasi RCC1774]
MLPARILAVDDSPDNLLLLETLLEDLDEYELTCVENGLKALEFIHHSPPDLILLDVMMPGIDGYEVAQRIRSNEQLPFIPILLLTAHEQSSVVTGLDAGADDFIRKPFQIGELMARIRALLRLKYSIDEQQKMLRQRDDFVARMTHDLRTPLIAANRMLQFCLKGSFGQSLADISPALSNIVDSNDNLLQMVNTLLEVYRHEAGRKQLTLSQVNLYELCQEVMQTLQALADEKQLTLAIQADEDDFCIQGDCMELRRVITNLVGNAIKFTQKGSVALHLDCETTPQRRVVLQVQDTGAGIEPEMQHVVFEWFRQGAHVKGGSGLGLHLVHRIVALHHGTVSVQSQVGEGSTFTVSLPSQQV